MVYLRKLMSNGFFLKYFTINYVLNFMYIMFHEKSFNKKVLLMANDNKNTSLIIMITESNN